jgi:hypothetical protein
MPWSRRNPVECADRNLLDDSRTHVKRVGPERNRKREGPSPAHIMRESEYLEAHHRSDAPERHHHIDGCQELP